MSLRVLILEDRPDDALLVAEHLRRAGLAITWERVETEPEFAAKLGAGWDLIIADYSQPEFSAPRALAMLKAANLDIPFIVISGNIGEDAAVEAMRSGAHDYLFKGNLQRLRPAVDREVRAAAERKTARADQDALRRLAATVATSTDAIITADLNGSILNWNAGAERMYGYTAEEMIGQNLSIIVPDDRADDLRGALERVWHGEQIDQLETVRRKRDGTLIEVSISLAPLTDAHGTVIATTGITRDVSSAKQAALALRASEERYRQIVETAFEGVWIIDNSNRTTFVNRRMADMLGYAPEEMLGKPVLTFMDADAQAVFAVNGDQRQSAHQPEHEFRFRRKDGSELWVLLEASPDRDEAGNYVGSLAMVTDVTERRRAQKALEYQALHDALTGLPNRVQLADRLRHALESARAANEQVAVLILDLDHFKEVNETFGHQAGDRLLEQVGPRLRSELRTEDMVARLGGDEFAVLLAKTDATAATLTAARLLEVLERPFEVEGQHLDVAVSIGIAMSPDDGDDPDTLLRRADIALFVAKQPRGSFVRYAPEHERQGASRLALMADCARRCSTTANSSFSSSRW